MKKYRVVYGETRPMWEKIFPTLNKAEEFAIKQESVGDIVYSVKKVVEGEPPQSITAAIEAEHWDEAKRDSFMAKVRS